MELPKYKCHKEVKALKITAIEFIPRGNGAANITSNDLENNTWNTDINYKERFKGDDNDLGYYVQYEDGYESWSPTKAFEDGYSKVK